jgi:hypothetical protein
MIEVVSLTALGLRPSFRQGETAATMTRAG